MMHWGNGYEHMGWGGHTAWMGIWWLLAAVLVAALAWALVKATRRPASAPSESPGEILKRRYANGEIDRETYQRTLTDLKG